MSNFITTNLSMLYDFVFLGRMTTQLTHQPLMTHHLTQRVTHLGPVAHHRIAILIRSLAHHLHLHRHQVPHHRHRHHHHQVSLKRRWQMLERRRKRRKRNIDPRIKINREYILNQTDQLYDRLSTDTGSCI